MDQKETVDWCECFLGMTLLEFAERTLNVSDEAGVLVFQIALRIIVHEETLEKVNADFDTWILHKEGLPHPLTWENFGEIVKGIVTLEV